MEHDFVKRVFGKKRYFKQIDKKEFHFLFDSSPLELDSAVEFYDIESFEYFLVINFSRVVPRRIASFKIRLFLYLDSPLPYKKITYTYNVPKKKISDKILGADDYIPIPETYFKRYEIFLDEVVWEDGEVQTVGCSTLDRKTVAPEKHITEIDAQITHSETSEKYPAVVMPQFSNNAWICTCSQKNTSEDTVCVRCSRERGNLEKMLEKTEISKDSYSQYQRARKVEHITARTYEKTSEAKEKKIEAEIEKVEKREKYKDKMRVQALPRIVLYFVAGYLIYLFLRWVESL